jgi:hypothetical protein
VTEKVAKNCKTYWKDLIFEIARSLGSRQGGGRMEEHSGADIVLASVSIGAAASYRVKMKTSRSFRFP